MKPQQPRERKAGRRDCIVAFVTRWLQFLSERTMRFYIHIAQLLDFDSTASESRALSLSLYIATAAPSVRYWFAKARAIRRLYILRSIAYTCILAMGGLANHHHHAHGKKGESTDAPASFSLVLLLLFISKRAYYHSLCTSSPQRMHSHISDVTAQLYIMKRAAAA